VGFLNYKKSDYKYMKKFSKYYFFPFKISLFWRIELYFTNLGGKKFSHF
jgi:hypothetical protein